MTGRWTTSHIPDQRGRTIVVTGANAGLGFQTARALALKGARVVLAVRDLGRGALAAERITAAYPRADVSLAQVDLSSLRSIRAAARGLLSDHERIDVLINNAGVVLTPRSTTSDGFELHFGTNHLGHFALTGLLLERLLPVPGSRVVTVTSLSYRMRAKIRFDDLQWERRYSSFGAYAQSKLANLLFTYELQRRLAGERTIAVAAHPGFANTDLARGRPKSSRATKPLAALLLQKPDTGALPILRAATDPGVLGGQFFGPRGFGQTHGYPRIVGSNARSHDAQLQRRLWTVSETLTGVVYPKPTRDAECHRVLGEQ
jgi:NAD(P)-dependent dehydrogenase (short-subunit alcohol dehydrogenase family)